MKQSEELDQFKKEYESLLEEGLKLAQEVEDRELRKKLEALNTALKEFDVRDIHGSLMKMKEIILAGLVKESPRDHANRLILEALTDFLQKNPDQRFGQALVNLDIVRCDEDEYNLESSELWERVRLQSERLKSPKVK